MQLKKIITVLAAGVVLSFPGVTFAQSNLYTFSGDVDLGVDYIGFGSSGLHYIGSRGDTVYVVFSIGNTYCQESTDGGQTFGSPVRVNSTPDGVNPSMKVDTAGVIYVAYQHSADIYFTKSTDGGTNFTPGVKVNDDTTPQIGQEIPAIAVNNKGHIFIVWRDQRTAPGEPHRAVFVAASHNSGQTFTPNVQINDSTTPMGGVVDVAADNEHVYIVWEPYAPRMIVSRSDDSGITFPFRSFVNDLPPDSSFGAGGKPSLAIGNGLVGVAWQDYRYDRLSIRFAVSADLGQTFSPSVIVDSGSENLQSPSLFWKNGIFYAVWRADHPRPSDLAIVNHIFFSYSPDGGQSFVPYVDVNAEEAILASHNGGSISVNDEGKAFVVWADNRYDRIYGLNWHLFVSAGTPSYIKGDLNLDGRLSPVDVVMELNAVFLDQPFPAPFETADGNCDGQLSPADVSSLLLATFLGTPFPC